MMNRRDLLVGMTGIGYAWSSHAASELVVAQVGPMTGPLGPNGVANFLGAKACFDLVNAQGGVNGEKIRFVREDDRYKADETLRLLELVTKRDKPVAFVNVLGSANVSAVLKEKLLDRIEVPVIGVTPGAEDLRQPGSPWLFHVHAGDKSQIERILSHLSTLGATRVAVVYQDIPFGKSGLALVDKLAGPMKIEVLGRVPVPAGSDDLKVAAAELRKTGAQTYLMILAPNSGASLIRDARQAGDRTPIYGMSYVPVDAIVAKAPPGSAVGVALAQVTPNASTLNTGVTREFRQAMSRFAPDVTEPSQLHLVGYLAARITVEGLRLAGANPTPTALAKTLRRVRMDLGGYIVDFTGGDNVGSRYVNIGVVDGRGRLMY
jgi:ABC-type branched-subunit amino acid transport system substrate-binding protein